MTARPDVCTATGNLVAAMPPGPERDEILGLVRLAVEFKKQHCGRRPGYLTRELLQIVRRIGEPVTFERMLEGIEGAAVRRALDGEAASPFEKVNRVWELVTYHEPRKGAVQVTFATLQNKLTACKKKLRA
ncbi:MAG: hypothetical protein M0P42_15010 [Gallionella sp.]|jgi:hypothetical protein|nr:hypothetical protein [Gallionella sp.]